MPAPPPQVRASASASRISRPAAQQPDHSWSFRANCKNRGTSPLLPVCLRGNSSPHAVPPGTRPRQTDITPGIRPKRAPRLRHSSPRHIPHCCRCRSSCGIALSRSASSPPPDAIPSAKVRQPYIRHRVGELTATQIGSSDVAMPDASSSCWESRTDFS